MKKRNLLIILMGIISCFSVFFGVIGIKSDLPKRVEAEEVTPKYYTLVIKSGYDGGAEDLEILISPGSSYTLTDALFEREGYILTGFQTTTGKPLDLINGSRKITPTASSILIATWTPCSYSLAYDSNCDDVANEEKTGVFEAVFTTITMERTGYELLGWSFDQTATEAEYAPNAEVVYSWTEDKTLYAVWKVCNYKLYWNGNFENVITSITRHDYQTTLTMKYFTLFGYELLGWAFDQNATTPDFAPNEDVVYSWAEDITLYAVYEFVGTKIFLNSGGVADKYAEAALKRDNIHEERNNEPLESIDGINNKVGYTFLGYTLTEGGEDILLKPDFKWEKSIEGYTDSIGRWIYEGDELTLYAKWQRDVYQINLDSDADGETDEILSRGYGDPSDLPVLSKTGYQFNGWKTSDGESFEETTIPLIEGGSLNLTADWIFKTPTVDCVSLDGNALALDELNNASVEFTYDGQTRNIVVTPAHELESVEYTYKLYKETSQTSGAPLPPWAADESYFTDSTFLGETNSLSVKNVADKGLYYLLVTARDGENKSARTVKILVSVNKATPNAWSNVSGFSYSESDIDLANHIITTGNVAYTLSICEKTDVEFDLNGTLVTNVTKAGGSFSVSVNMEESDNYLAFSKEVVFGLGKGVQNISIVEPADAYYVKTQYAFTVRGAKSAVSFGCNEKGDGVELTVISDGTVTVTNRGVDGKVVLTAVAAETDLYGKDEKSITFYAQKIDAALPSELPQGLSVCVGNKLSTVVLPDGFAWTDGSLITETAGNLAQTAIYTPEDTENYNSVEVSLTVSVKEHSFKGEYLSDDGGHWRICENCSTAEEKQAHLANEDDGDCTTAITCSVCSFAVEAGNEEHSFSDTYLVENADENKHYHVCTVEGCHAKDEGESHGSSGVATPENPKICPTCNYVLEIWTPHEHNVCADDNCSHAGNSHSSVETYETIAWNDVNKYDSSLGGYTVPSGNYYLSNNLSGISPLILKDVNLCLNGKTLKVTDHTTTNYIGKIIFMGNCTICDCSEEQTGKIENTLIEVVGEGSTLNYYGGKILWNDYARQDQIILVGEGATVNLYGGIMNHYYAPLSAITVYGSLFAHDFEMQSASSNSIVVENGGFAHFKGGSYNTNSNVLYNRGNVLIEGGSFNVKYAVLMTCLKQSYTEIKGGAFSRDGSDSAFIYLLGAIKISGSPNFNDTDVQMGNQGKNDDGVYYLDVSKYEGDTPIPIKRYSSNSSFHFTQNAIVAKGTADKLVIKDSGWILENSFDPEDLTTAVVKIVCAGHTNVEKEGQAPTCTENGWSAYVECSHCGYNTKTEISALGHKAGSEATCTTAQICTICEEVLVPALGHTAGSKATCTTAQICTVCEEVLIPALGHKAGSEATCTTAQICTICEEILVPALGHTAGSEATCTTAQICTVCEEILVPALGHKAGSEATCTTAQICTVCEEVLVPALGHTAGSEWIIDVEATCSQEGSKHKECTVCKIELSKEIVQKTAHKEGEWIIDKEATCSQEGSKHKECTVCKIELSKEIVQKTAHKESKWIVDKEATCSQEGSKYKECTVCKIELSKEIVQKTAHKESEWIVDKEASKDEKGLKHKECSVCGERLIEEEIPKTSQKVGCKMALNGENSLSIILCLIISLFVVGMIKIQKKN